MMKLSFSRSPIVLYARYESKNNSNKIHASINKLRLCRDRLQLISYSEVVKVKCPHFKSHILYTIKIFHIDVIHLDHS